jgi:hypothetical protein
MLIFFNLFLRKDLLLLAETGNSNFVVLQLGSLLFLIHPSTCQGSFRTVGLRSKKIDAGSISSIMIVPMLFISVIPFHPGNSFSRELIPQYLLFLLVLYNRKRVLESTNFDLSILVQEHSIKVKCAMIESGLFVNIGEAIN